MTRTTPTPRDAAGDASGRLLAAVVARREAEHRAAVDVLTLVAEFAAANRVEDPAEAATEDASPIIGDHGIPLAGEGAPLVAEFAVVELGAALGMSTLSARKLVGDVLELAHRLPATWARVRGYAVPAWKARLIAQSTKILGPEAAAFVDATVAPTAERYGYARLERLVAEAAARYAPDLTALADAEAATGHHVTVITRTRPGAGLDTNAAHAYVEATLDPADALDLDAAISAIAHGLLQQEQTAHLSLDQRRAKALGILGRHYTTGQTGNQTGGVPGTARVVHLYCHTTPGDGTGLVAVDNLKTVVPLERLEEWATTPGTVVKPVTVIDLNTQLTRDGYVPSPVQREQAYLLARVCAFPGCDKPATPTGQLDLDHIQAHGEGGKTETQNLAPLCRGHHRVKTHDNWTYRQTRPGEYLWTSPHGAVYLRHHGGGTTTITNPHADPHTDTG